MLRQILLICCLLAGSTASVCAQTADSFEDGNATSDPVWSGDDSLFQVNTSLQLQSKGTTTKDISLSTPVSVAEDAEWSIWCRFAFNPSTSNYCRYYLLSDSANLKSKLNGYYIQFGGVTGSQDSITLYKQKGTIRTRIIGGRPATVVRSNNIVRVRVVRDKAGNWQLFSDTSGGRNYTLEGSGTDSEFANSSYMGVFAHFTSSNASGFYFDDVYAGPVIVDSVPPRIDSVKVILPNQLRIVFNEQVTALSALNVANYELSNGYGIPSTAAFYNGKPNIVLLTFPDAIVNNGYHLTATNIEDMAGNTLNMQQVFFNYYVFNAQIHDVLISEFFPDPSPPEDLPEHEFIELYNRTPVIVPLKGWTISDGASTATLPDVVLEPNGYIILCATANEQDFVTWGKTVGLTSFPTLNNTGDQLVLKDEKGNPVHEISYDLGWYHDQSKDGGGWTIEMTNPFDLCKGKNNYAASVNVNGGTPGETNSNWSTQPDTLAPMITGVVALHDSAIAVLFGESMDSSSLNNTMINISGGLTIVSKQVVGVHNDSLILCLTPALGMNLNYILDISKARDCNQNEMLPVSRMFTRFVPDEPSAYDVLINELLADPDPLVALPNAEFVELYNRSDKIVSLKDWTLHDDNATAVLPDYILLPDSYVVITSASNLPLFAGYTAVLGVSNFPNLANDGDAITLADNKSRVIHHLVYASASYNNDMKKTGGWTLELIDKKNPCGTQNLAASTDVSGGTPGRHNSVRGSNPDNDAPKLLRAYPLNENELKLTFSEDLDSTTLLDLQHFHVNNNTILPNEIYQKGPAYSDVVLSFADPLLTRVSYRVVVDSVRDCAGNYLEYDDYADFGIPEPFDSFDIAINEILFNPKGTGSDYVEIVNRTDKMIDLKDVLIANADYQNEVKDYFAIAPNGFLLFPHAYVVITPDPFSLQASYFTPNPRNIIQCTLPSFNDDEGKCLLIDKSGNRYDQLNYDDNMHFALLDEKDGVSLERIDYNRPSKDYTNWTSASSTSGFGTPTYRNSQYAKAAEGEEMLKIQPEVFSPDGDGYNDVATFNYALTKPGCVGNLYIYDANGTMVKHLLRNEMLGTTGSFSWDGVTDEMDTASVGIYVCYFEVLNTKGNVSKKKKTLVVGGKL